MRPATSVGPGFERAVVAELALRERRAGRHARHVGSGPARALAERLHDRNRDLLLHLRRVAIVVPSRFRAVAWLHHAHEEDPHGRALGAARLSEAEHAAIVLFGALPSGRLDRARALADAPGTAGQLARVVARAAIEDRLDSEQTDGETASALLALPGPELVR